MCGNLFISIRKSKLLRLFVDSINSFICVLFFSKLVFTTIVNLHHGNDLLISETTFVD